jgi:imidazolonepropionase-like amidohydrolase
MLKVKDIHVGNYIDAHVHIENARGLEVVCAAGIIGVRDAGTRSGAGLSIAGGRFCEKRLFVVSAGWALSKKGGYGSRFGTPVRTRSEIKYELDMLKKAGAGIIKIMASGVVSMRRPGSITAGGFTSDEIQYIVDQAAELGLAVMAHANGEDAIISAASAGVRSVEHGFFMTKKSLDAMAKAGTFWTPTLGALVRASRSDTVTAEARVYINGLVRTHLKMVGFAHSIGIHMAIGTDCVLPCREYEKVYADELSFFEQAGLPLDAVNQIARDGGKELLGL